MAKYSKKINKKYRESILSYCKTYGREKQFEFLCKMRYEYIKKQMTKGHLKKINTGLSKITFKHLK